MLELVSYYRRIVKESCQITHCRILRLTTILLVLILKMLIKTVFLTIVCLMPCKQKPKKATNMVNHRVKMKHPTRSSPHQSKQSSQTSQSCLWVMLKRCNTQSQTNLNYTKSSKSAKVRKQAKNAEGRSRSFQTIVSRPLNV